MIAFGCDPWKVSRSSRHDDGVARGGPIIASRASYTNRTNVTFYVCHLVLIFFFSRRQYHLYIFRLLTLHYVDQVPGNPSLFPNSSPAYQSAPPRKTSLTAQQQAAVAEVRDGAIHYPRFPIVADR